MRFELKGNLTDSTVWNVYVYAFVSVLNVCIILGTEATLANTGTQSSSVMYANLVNLVFV